MWALALSRHPDKAFARYVCTGLRFGFRIGFTGRVHLKSAQANMGSAIEHPSVVTEYLAKEIARGRMLGPFDMTEPLPPLHINRFGVSPRATTRESGGSSQICHFPGVTVSTTVLTLPYAPSHTLQSMR